MNEIISSVILIGGQSKRFGFPKHLATYNGKTFLNIIENALSPLDVSYSVHRIDVNLPYDKQIVDTTPRIGPIGAIARVLTTSTSSFTLITSCDLPLISNELVMNMVGYAISHNKTTVCYADGYLIPTFAIYKKTDSEVFEAAIANKQYKLVDVIKQIDHFQYNVPNNYKRCLTNVNTQTELCSLHKPFVFAVSGYKNSGKTTLISKLIQLYKSDNYKVASIKHDGHDFEVNANTDSGKFVCNGSDKTTVFSNSKYQTTTIGNFDIDDWITNTSDYDVIIIEGMKESNYLKIVIDDQNSLQTTNQILCLNQNTRNDVDAIYKKLREVEYERCK